MDMDMSSSLGSACDMTMLWNWNTIDSCFLSASWHITTKGMFAVSCIGVAFLVIALEFLRRLSKDYEDSITRQFQRHVAAQTDDIKIPFACNDTNLPTVMTFRASPLQQIVRALIHMAQFGVAYIIMLIAMNYNGFMIISIFIGAFLGKLFCDWGQYKVVVGQRQSSPQKPAPGIIDEPTSCCG